MLHVRCGEDILPTLDALGLPGDRLSWADPLCQGPLVAGLDRPALRRLRAPYIADGFGLAAEQVAADLERADEALVSARCDEVVLWFEHDLYDQAILVYLLAWLAQERPDQRLTLVQGHVHLAHLPAGELGQLFAERRPVGTSMVAFARRAWTALASGDPAAIAAIDDDPSDGLPFVGAAWRRWLAELPALGDGLGETERLALQSLIDGPLPVQDVYRSVQRRERAVWAGDLQVYALLRELAEGEVPLLAAEGTWGTFERQPTVTLSLTPAGRHVLAGHADRVALRGYDRHHGALHLHGRDLPWRWDPARGRPVRVR